MVHVYNQVLNQSVFLFQEMCLAQEKLEALPVPVALYLLSHCFVQLSHQVTLVPSKCAEKNFVLALDIITLYMSLRTKLTTPASMCHQAQIHENVLLKVVELFEGQDRDTLTKKLNEALVKE